MRPCGLFLGLFALWLASCTDRAGHRRDTVELAPTDKLELPLDSTTSNQMEGQYLMDHKSGREYLVFFVQKQRRLLFYDPATQKLAFATQFAAEGPDGVGDACGFHAVSLDSIFLEGSPLRFFLADTSGRVKRTYSLQGKDDAQGYPILSYCTISNLNLAAATGPTYHFFRWPSGFEKDLAVRRQPFLAQLDLATGGAKMLPAFYPKFYHENFWSIIHMEAGITRAPSGFVFNFPASDSVYAWQDGQTVAHYAASRFITTPIKPVASVPTTEEGLDRPIIEQQCYASLGYDPWRQVYYRIAWHPHDDLSNVGNILRIYAEKPCSIIILDKDLNIIGETMLPRDRYFTMRWFIGPKGLYISDAHPDNPDLDEDVLSYTLFTLAKRKDE
jgi:hypothetical protein